MPFVVEGVARVAFTNTPGQTPAAPDNGEIKVQQADGYLITRKSDGTTRNTPLENLTTVPVLQQELLKGVVQPTTGFFWSAWNQAATTAPSAPSGIPAPTGKVGGVRVNRAERMLVGGARVCTSDFPASTKDYLTAYEAARTDYRGFRVDFAQFASLSEIGAYGVIGATRSSDNQLNGLQATNGGAFFAINDKPGAFGAGGYSIGWRGVGAGFTGGWESAVADQNPGGGDQVYPSAMFPTGNSHALLLNSGGAMRTGEVFNASYALGISDVGARFKAGIVFGADSLERYANGIASAIRLPALASFEWYRTDQAEVTPSFRVLANVATQANAQVFFASDSGVYIGSADFLRPSLSIGYFGAAQTAYPSISGGNGAANLQAVPSSGTDADLNIGGAGAGVVNLTSLLKETFFTPASSSAPGRKGMSCKDENFTYVCVATNTWKRQPLVSW
jgi:hypothetical protein